MTADAALGGGSEGGSETGLEASAEAGLDAGVETRIDAEGWRAASGDAADLAIGELVETAAMAALAEAAYPPERAAISVLLCDDAEIAALNERFRGVAGPTDVLAWPSGAGLGPAAARANDGATFLGDVAVALETTRSDAEAAGKTLEDHLRHLIIHGVLHLLGFDHDTPEDAAEMQAREIAALARLNVRSPYA